MVTVRQLAACLGVAPTLSVRGLFGGAQPPLSLLSLIMKAMQRQVDLNLILVGEDESIDASDHPGGLVVDLVRGIYATVDLGIGNVQLFAISEEDAGGYVDIDSPAEAIALREQFGFAGTAVDVFLVDTWAGSTLGSSPVCGPCRTGDEPDSGLVIAAGETSGIWLAPNVLAHEVGHYLCLMHDGDPDNLMFDVLPNGGVLTTEQGQTMKRHCMVYTGCRPG